MTTLQNFGVPMGGGTGRGGIIMPKPRHKFRVRVFKFGPIAGGIELSQQVVSVGRPSVQSNAQEVHSYNSIAYYAGKAVWSSINLTVRDDITNSVSKLVGHQEQKQMNHFAQTSTAAGLNYKFDMYIETLDGGNETVLEQWFLEGCFLESINYGNFDYSSSDPLTIEMSVRYDNATQAGGLMPQNPETISGSMVG